MVMNCPGYSDEFDPTLIFRKILVPIDFTPESRHALITACETRKRFGSELHLFVETDPGQSSALRGLGVTWGPDGHEKDAREMLGYFADSICAGTHCLTTHATFGESVVKGIADAAKECGATMVIMGVRDKHSLLRSRAERIVQSLDIPVMLLKHTESLAARPSPKPVAAAANG